MYRVGYFSFSSLSVNSKFEISFNSLRRLLETFASVSLTFSGGARTLSFRFVRSTGILKFLSTFSSHRSSLLGFVQLHLVGRGAETNRSPNSLKNFFRKCDANDRNRRGDGGRFDSLHRPQAKEKSGFAGDHRFQSTRGMGARKIFRNRFPRRDFLGVRSPISLHQCADDERRGDRDEQRDFVARELHRGMSGFQRGIGSSDGLQKEGALRAMLGAGIGGRS